MIILPFFFFLRTFAVKLANYFQTIYMRKLLTTVLLALATFSASYAQRITDKLDRGLIAQKVSSGVYLNWRILGEEYYDVTYNVYRDGVKLNETPLSVSNYKDNSGTTASKYTVSAVVRGVEQKQCAAVSPWSSSYKEIKLTHDDIKSTLIPNDACCADVDGDGEVEILMKFDNESEISQSFPKNGPKINGVDTKEYSIFEVLKLDGKRLWWVNCGPNMGDFQNNEQNIVGYDWDCDGKAEVIMRLLEGSTIHMADGSIYTIGSNGQNSNSWTNYRAATGGGTNWFMHEGKEFLVYCNGATGEIYQCIDFPLARLESGETSLDKAWGDGYGHRSNKFFFGAPYLDGHKPSVFLARGIYTRHKMAAYDVEPNTHKLIQRWKWYNNSNGYWKGQGFHNYGIADVDEDGRDEIVYGSMVIDDNGKGLSTTGLGHGDAQHCSDFNPYTKGLEIYTCNEDQPGNNYRNATTSKIYHRYDAGRDDGRAMMGNFTDNFPGSQGCSAREGAISSITYGSVSGMDATGINTNFRIYWDGDLCSETFNYLNGKNTEGCVAKYGSWTPIYTCSGSMTNNDTKGTPCYQGDILGDWREEIIMRTANNNIRIYSTPTSTSYRIPTLWSDHQYRNAMVWQMCGYNQPPHISYFLGKLEGMTQAPPPLTMTDREEVNNGGTVDASFNDKHVILRENKDTKISLAEGAKPYILTINVPSWVQGSAGSEYTAKEATIKYQYYTCNVESGSLAGNARLVKQGDGTLNLHNSEFTHTGETNIWGGKLNFDGSMKQSPLWLNRFTELNSNGGQFQSITTQYASVIRPGGANNKGDITTDSLRLGFGSRIIIDLYGEDITADKINTKYLSIEKKTGIWETAGPEYLAPIIELVGHVGTGDKNLAAGKYVIGTVSGDVVGKISDIIVEGIATSKKELRLEEGKLILEIFGSRDASSVVWTAASSSIWDLNETENFSISEGTASEATTFVANDDVLFNDDASSKTVTISGSVIPGSITVNNSSAYTFKGDGSIDGSGKFIKEGSGTVTMSSKNSYTGGNYLKGGVVKVALLSNQYSEVGNLGGITKSADKFTMENSATLQTTAAVEQGSPMKMVGTDGGIINNSADFKMDASFSGTKLTKKGSGSLFLNASNSSLTNLVITAGGVALAANAQPKSVEVQGGTIWDDGQNTSHAIVVPKGKTGYWNLSYTYYTAYANKVTGEGTLVVVPRNTVSRVRITGDWSAFEGTIKHTTKDIALPLDNSKGLPKGTLDIASGCTVANTVGQTYQIGRLTGAGTLMQPYCDFKSQAAVSGNVTWKVGNSLEQNGDFKFEGKITDNGSNKCNFEKIGSCKMTVTGAWENSGSIKISDGELHLNSGATLGTGSLTVGTSALLTGTSKSGAPMTNSAVTVNGAIQPGATATSTTGSINFNGKNIIMGSASEMRLAIRKAISDEGKYAGTGLENIGNLKFLSGAKIVLTFQTDYVPQEGDEFRIFNNLGSVTGTPVIESNHGGIEFDTSRIADGIISIKSYNSEADAIHDITLDDLDNAVIYTLSGIRINGRPSAKGLYIVNGKKVFIK